MRIGVDNWNVLYTRKVLGFSDYLAVNATMALEMGRLAGSLLWGTSPTRWAAGAP